MYIHKDKFLIYYVWLLQILVAVHYLISLNLLAASNMVKVVEYIICLSLVFLVSSYTLSRRLPVGIVQGLWFCWIGYLLLSAMPQVHSSSFHLKHFLQIDLVVYTIPLLMVASPTIEFYKSLIKLSFVGVVVYLLTSLIIFSYNPIKSEGLTFLLGGGLPLLLMTLPYHAKSKTKCIYIVLVIVLVLMMILARRNKVVYFGGAAALAIFINMVNSSELSRRRKGSYVFIMTAVLIGLVVVSDKYFTDFTSKMGTGMASREIVIELFYDDFNRTPSDWVWGRGIFGQVDAGCSGDEETGLRDGIENGYLSLILKGGWIWLGLLIITSILSIYKGFLKSNNLLCKGFAMIILLYFVDMIGFGIPGISFKYSMIFISIAGCNTEWLRNCTDSYLAEEIGLK